MVPAHPAAGDRHCSWPRGIRGGGTAGSGHHPEPALGNCIPSGVWRRHNCRNDGHHDEPGFGHQGRRRAKPDLLSPIGDGFWGFESGIRLPGCVSDRLRQRLVHQQSDVDAEVVIPQITTIARPCDRRSGPRWLRGDGQRRSPALGPAGEQPSSRNPP